MKSYKGIDLERDKNLSNYIKTYYSGECVLKDAYMESDRVLQKMVNRHHAKKSAYTLLFSLCVYVVFFSIFQLTRG